jgi:hypothetical protein
MTLRALCRNLVGIPSFHYEPLFARAVRQAIRQVRPEVIALELPEWLRGELDWALRCWPTAVGSITTDLIVPWIPGDSMLEAGRLAQQLGIRVHLVDLAEAEPSGERSVALLPGPEFAPRVGQAFQDAVDATAEPPSTGDLAREAFMAERLDELMRRHRRVLWVGGMAHWTRLTGRLERGDFSGPPARGRTPGPCRRVRLGGSALLRLTGRSPFLVARYAEHPASYDEASAIRHLALDAARLNRRRREARRHTYDGEHGPGPAEPAAIDIARVLVYARNLAATRTLSDRPGLADLLTAASVTVGKRYAGQVYLLSMKVARPRRASVAEALRNVPALTYESVGSRQGYRCKGRWLTVEPVWSPAGPRIEMWVPAPAEVARRQQAPYRHVPRAQKGSRYAWMAYPPDEQAYEAYVAHVLRRASLHTLSEPAAEPFLAGLRDGIDVRATLRHWKEGRLYVREDRGEWLTVTNGAIDYTSEREDSTVLRGLGRRGGRAGWVDPSLTSVGSASREIRVDVIQKVPCHVTLRHREFSLITLDVPTWLEADDSRGFYSRVIKPLVHLPAERDHLYGWLDVMFAFCRGKPFAYYSRYVPGPRIHEIAARHRVRLLHRPLQLIGSALLQRHQTFRFLSVTRQQWEALEARIEEGRITWGLGAAEGG